MGVQYNSRIVTDGLVLALDAGNNKSHSSNRFISYGSGLVTEGVGFAVNGDGIFQRIAAGTVIGGYTVKTTDVVYSYALGSNGCHYHGNSTPIPAGVYATFTCDYLVTNATNYPVNGTLLVFENYGGGALQPSGVGVPNNLQNVWQRVTLTAGPTSSAGTQAMFLYPGYCGGRMADSGTLYMRNPRVEWTNVDTGTENFSSRPNTNIWYDISGNGNNGTLNNIPYHFIANSTTGSVGYFKFEGTDDYCTTGFTRGTLGNYLTISAWYKYLGTSGRTYSAIIGGKEPPGIGTEFFIGKNAGNTNIGIQDGNYYDSFVTGSNAFDGNWHHLVYTYDNGTGKIYLDSVLKNTNSFTKCNDAEEIIIGGETEGSGYYFDGHISSVSFYNRVLTASEVQQNYNALKSRYIINIVTDGLVLNLDAGSSGGYSGTTWKDLSGVIGDVNVQNRSTDWSFQTDSSSGQVCLYNDSNRVSNPGINIPVNNGFNKLEGTIDIWLKPTSHTGGIGWFNNSDGNGSTNAGNWFWIGTWDTSNVLYFRQGNPSTCCNDLTISSFTGAYPLNTWQHWSITWKVSAGYAAIYKNGVLQTSTTGLPTNIPNTNPTNTGQLFNGHERSDNMQFRGYCNAYKIYNRALTATEIQQNFDSLRVRFGV